MALDASGIEKGTEIGDIDIGDEDEDTLFTALCVTEQIGVFLVLVELLTLMFHLSGWIPVMYGPFSSLTGQISVFLMTLIISLRSTLPSSRNI